ncbi:CopG family ribbon-helix-helix protein [Aliivibrio salmonicida]|uniref:CopG family ribbon-helix-helix protein n=1 Tax=Aliivibrio salmonicida TaxID=40269 RepID=UPI00406BF290
MASMSVRIPDSLEQQLSYLAESTGRTKSWLAKQALQDYLEKESWQIAEINKALKEADLGDFASNEDVSFIFNKWGVNED